MSLPQGHGRETAPKAEWGGVTEAWVDPALGSCCGGLGFLLRPGLDEYAAGGVNSGFPPVSLGSLSLSACFLGIFPPSKGGTPGLRCSS